MNKKLIFIIFSSLLLSSCYNTNNRSNSLLCKDDKATIIIKDLILDTELACSDNEKATGLMYRKKLPENNAMLFVYDNDQILSFWMMNTFIPLSIAYIDSNGKIVDIFDIEPLDETPISSSEKVRYALEVNQGLFEKYNIKINDTVTIQ